MALLPRDGLGGGLGHRADQDGEGGRRRTASRVRPDASGGWPSVDGAADEGQVGADMSRSGKVAAPRSRTPARCRAAPDHQTIRTATGTNAIGRGVVSGRDSSIQPRGLSHTNQCSAGSESATMRRA